jgi:tRNA(Ile)-lysidine synthase
MADGRLPIERRRSPQSAISNRQLPNPQSVICMDLVDRVRKVVRRHGLSTPSDRVVAAVSGGSDSVALLHLLRRLHESNDLVLVGIAHLNHRLRAAAGADQAVAVRAAESLGLPAYVESADVRGRAELERRSIEDAAHVSRYEFFDRARLHFDAHVVALGHTRDDQAETVLLRLLRGAGPHGWAGMYPKHGPIVRPLLECRRSELRAYLEAHSIEYVDDESNADGSIVRNRVRAELMPLIESRFNPSAADVLSDEATIAREIWKWLGDETVLLSEQVVRTLPALPPQGPGEELDVERLNHSPTALARAVVWSALGRTAGGRQVTFNHVETVLALMRGDEDGGLDLPGQRVERIGGRVVLRSRPAGVAGRWQPREAAGSNDATFSYPLNVPGEVELVEAQCVICAQPWSTAAEAAADAGAVLGTGSCALVRSDLCRGALFVRNRHPGDRFRPVGLNGHKKLQDLFVDCKVERADRARIPIVVDENDRIIWVAGYGIDEAFRVTDPAQAVLLLTVKVVGGPA